MEILLLSGKYGAKNSDDYTVRYSDSHDMNIFITGFLAHKVI
jgi:hypothetical protein